MSDVFEYDDDDVADGIRKLDRRLKAVEQDMASPTLLVGAIPTKFPDGIYVGEDLHPLGEDVSSMGDLDVETLVHFGQVSAAFSWTAVEHGHEYEIELVRWNNEDELWEDPSYYRTAGTGYTVTNLLPDEDYGARIWAINPIGLRGDPYPAEDPAAVYVEFTTPIDDTIPAQPGTITIARGSTTVVVIVPEPTDFDVANGQGLIQVEIDTANTFATGNLQTIKSGQAVVAFNTIIAEAAWYGRARYIDSSGNEGPWSTTAGPTTAGGVIDSMIVAGLNAAKITFGVMSGDRINANTADIAILKTSELTAADITLNGGSLKAGSPPTTGLLINSSGLRLYAAGVQTMTLDAATGAATFRGNMAAGTITIGSNFSVDASGNLVAANASFTGSINSGSTITGATITGGLLRTAASGARLEIGSSYITFYNSGGSIGGIVPGGPGDGDIWINASLLVNQLWVDSGHSYGFNGGALYFHTLYAAGSQVIDSSRNITCSTLDVGGTDFTVSAAGVVGANGNITTNGIFTTNGFETVTTVPSAQVTTGGVLRRTTHANSSLRYKENVRPLGVDEVNWAGLMALQPVRFDLRPGIVTWDEDRYNQYGLIAEEVVEVLPEIVQLDARGRPDVIDYAKLSVFLLMAIQELNKDKKLKYT